MNKLFVISSLLLSLAGAAQAEGVSPFRISHLQTIRLDRQYGARGHVGGDVYLNLMQNTVRLRVSAAPICPPHAMCAQFEQEVIDATMKITSVTKGSCGETIYLAKQDLRRVDGNLEAIRLIDNSTNYCETLIAIPSVQGSFLMVSAGMDGKVVKTNSTFTASAFAHVDSL